MTLGNIVKTTEPRPRWSEAVAHDGSRKEIAAVTHIKIDLSVKSPVPHDIRLALQRAGATVDEANPHEFRLPWGILYTCPKINDGDRLAKESQISKLQRIIAAGPPQPQPVEPPPAPAPWPVPSDPSDPTPAGPNIKAKIAEQIKLHEAEEQRLLTEAEVHGRKVKTFQRIMEVVDEMPDAEALLATLIEPVAPPEPPKPVLPPPPPERITERGQVESRIVLLATQSFERPFSLDTLVEAMMRGKAIDDVERKRVRVCVANILKRLTDSGAVNKVREGARGKTGSALWERVLLPTVMASVNGAAAQ